jgi:hypothetical protein
MPRLVLLGVGAMNSPRYRPAGGGCADPGPPLNAWLVSDERAELMPQIRRRAKELGVRTAADGLIDTPERGLRTIDTHDDRFDVNAALSPPVPAGRAGRHPSAVRDRSA